MKYLSVLLTLVLSFSFIGCGGGGGGSNEPNSTEFIDKVEQTFTEDEATEAILRSVDSGNTLRQTVSAIMDDKLTEDGVILKAGDLNTDLIGEWLKKRIKEDLPDTPSYIAVIQILSDGYTGEQMLDAALSDWNLVTYKGAIYIVEDKDQFAELTDAVKPAEEPKENGVSDINTPPIAYGQSLPPEGNTLFAGQTVPITVTGADVDGDKFIFELVNHPAEGFLKEDNFFPTNGKLRFTAPNWNGVFIFTFRVWDEENDSESWPATVSIRIGPEFETLQFSGKGTTGIGYSGTNICDSTADWKIYLYATGTLYGNYHNEAPLEPSQGECVPDSYDIGKWDFSFTGTHNEEKGTFRIDSFGYYDYTHQSFIFYGTAIEGSYTEDMIETDPKYSETDDWGSVIEHYFHITK